MVQSASRVELHDGDVCFARFRIVANDGIALDTAAARAQMLRVQRQRGTDGLAEKRI